MDLAVLLSRSFSTTNLIENLNSQLKKHIGRVKYWMNSDMRSRWMAILLLQIEKRMRKVNNHEKLNSLIAELIKELKIERQRIA